MYLEYCGNDDNGNPTGLSTGFTVQIDGADLLQLECLEGIPCSVGYSPEHGTAVINIADKTFPVRGHTTYVGSITWNAVSLNESVAADILNHLKKNPAVTCVEAMGDLMDVWSRRDSFSVDVLLEASG